jgi:peptidoglycan DL-endopeptidase CwlO
MPQDGKIVHKPCLWCPDTGRVSIRAVVEQVAEVLGRAHGLFGDPPASGGFAARDAGSVLTGAGGLVRGGIAQISGLSGDFAAGYTAFGGRAGASLDGLAGTDQRLSDQLHHAARTDRTGRATSGGIVKGAAADTAALAPFTGSPAGQQALLTALRARVAHQHRVLAAYKARDARMAALLRSMTYAARASGGAGAMPFGGSGFGLAGPAGGGGFGASGLPVPARPQSTARAPHTVLAARVDPRAAAVPAGPGGTAVAAALSKRGSPYVWGAKGPNVFDCSGLTQWAWAQAGVRLGADTYTQVDQGVPVAPGDVRAGDLIFPRYSFDGRGPGHVQLAISPTEVVHAPQSGDVVRIVPMPAAYVARRPVPPASSAAEN